jgi:plastocyanin
VKPRRSRAPAASRGFAGAVFFAAFVVLGGCRETGPPAPRVLTLGGDTIVLGDSIDVLEVRVGRVDDGADAIDPPSLVAHVGDVVRFTSTDRGAHALAFDALRLEPAAREFLERTGQLRGPPLLEPGAVWVVNLADAPPGTYPFTCSTHGKRGTLSVRAAGT